MKNEFTAVLLAAGMGTRLGDITKDIPKPLIEVKSKALLGYAIDWCKYLGAKKIIVIGGFMFDIVKGYVYDIDKNILVLENENFAETHRMVSLLKAESNIAGDLLVQDADYIYHKEVGRVIENHDYKELTVHATKLQSTYCIQDVVAEVNEKGNLKNIYKTTGTEELGANDYYFNSLIYCPEDCVDKFFRVAKDSIKKRNDGWLHVEDAILDYIKTGNKVDLLSVKKPLWIEVDNQTELAAADKFLDEYRTDIP